MAVNQVRYIGGPFERFVQPSGDCGTKGRSAIVPNPAQLNCLAFSLPTNFSLSPTTDASTIASFLSFSNTDVECGGSDLVSRLTAVYGNISVNGYFAIQFQTAPSIGGSSLINGLQVSFSLEGNANAPILARCNVDWMSASVLPPVSYIVAYNTPVCGPKAPGILDASVFNRQKYVSAVVDASQNVLFDGINYATLFSLLFGVNEYAVSLKQISIFKFAITVTSNPATPTAENSCAYQYLAMDRYAVVRSFTLARYDLSGTQLVPNTKIEDGCISKGFIDENGFHFNADNICGNPDPSFRFSRYFDLISAEFFYLDVANGFFNVTVEIPSTVRRRDPTTLTFYFADLESTTTIPATLLPTASMATSTSIFSTVTTTNSVSVSSSTSSNTAVDLVSNTNLTTELNQILTTNPSSLSSATFSSTTFLSSSPASIQSDISSTSYSSYDISTTSTSILTLVSSKISLMPTPLVTSTTLSFNHFQFADDIANQIAAGAIPPYSPLLAIDTSVTQKVVDSITTLLKSEQYKLDPLLLAQSLGLMFGSLYPSQTFSFTAVPLNESTPFGKNGAVYVFSFSQYLVSPFV
ncbi:hypothetical protein HDU99_007868 [Rhizoclosmatium hyalinum]|nr:hypothetical protein HDU99_007868 [Rhizoclosmatium hyalinum]